MASEVHNVSDLPTRDSSQHPNWFENDVANPLWNSLVVRSANALHTVVAPIWQKATGHDLGNLEAAPVQADASPIGSAVQKATAAVGSIIPYLVASKVGGGLLRLGAEQMRIGGTIGRLATSERVGSILGASTFDALRNPDAGESRTGNFASSAVTFYMFGAGNRAFADAGLTGRIFGRVATGVVAADAGRLVANLTAQGQIGDGYADSALQGALFNSLFPLAHEGVTNVVDRVKFDSGKAIPASRFVDRAGLSGRVDGLAEALKAVPYAKARFADNPISDTPGTINVPHSATPDLQADILRTQLLNEAVARSRSAGGGAAWSNIDISKGLTAGQIGIDKFNPKQLKPYAYDVTLGTRFLKQPATAGRNFFERTPKQYLSDWAKRGFEQEYKGGITLAPGETVLGSTGERVTIRRVPMRNADGTMQDWQGQPPVRVDINQKSTWARHDLQIHATAPALYPGETEHEVVLEIRNNGPAPVMLKPGMRFGSLTFTETKSHALPDDFNENSVAGQTSVSGVRGNQDVRTITPTGVDYGFGGWLRGIILPFQDYSRLNGPARLVMPQPFEPQPLPQGLGNWEALRIDPSRQKEYYKALEALQREKQAALDKRLST